MVANLAVVGIAALSVWLRWDDPAGGAAGTGLWLSAVIAAALFFSGWLGGELAYRYRIGAIADDSPEVEQFHVEVEREARVETLDTGTSSRRV
jgi:uncharacterized membrane protein